MKRKFSDKAFSRKQYLAALLVGAASALGFAPFGLFPVPVLALTVLFWYWQQAATPYQAVKLGWVFGLGLFGAGINWLYVALHEFGEMPALLAALAILLFAAFLALFPALVGYAQARIRAGQAARLLLVMPALWVAVEWLRGMIFTGFPWLTLGYAHSGSPLAGYAPLLGVYGVSLVAAMSAGLLAMAMERCRSMVGKLCLAFLLALWVSGELLRHVEWTQPQGAPVSVALVQGNIAQELKFNPDALVGTLETYRRLALQSKAQLTVLPETALPLLRHELPETLLTQLREHATQNHGDMLIGTFERDDNGHFYNSVFTRGSAAEQHYHKQHLVPFGEFIPLRPALGWLINEVLHIPMGDLVRGDVHQTPLNVAGQQVAANICYEDVFGEEIIRALPQATLLVNVTNDAWYGHSTAAAQHNQISQFRALEAGRMMLRATNTGVTSIIDAHGRVVQQLPQYQEGVLSGVARGYQGSTPYVRWGNAAVLVLIAMMLAVAYGLSQHNSFPGKGRAGGA
jgi:apolipoprotein N-acyltransferase